MIRGALRHGDPLETGNTGTPRPDHTQIVMAHRQKLTQWYPVKKTCSRFQFSRNCASYTVYLVENL